MTPLKDMGQDFKKRLLTESPIPCDIAIGDTVTFTNDYGAVFHNLKVIGFCHPTYEGGGWIHLNTDAYWSPHHDAQLKVTHRAEAS